MENYGLTEKQVEDLVEAHGKDALELIFSALRQGFTFNLVCEILARFGVVILELLLKFFFAKSSLRYSKESDKELLAAILKDWN